MRLRFSALHAFVLPRTLWVHPAVGTRQAYAVLVGFGHAPAIGAVGDALVGVETRADAGCTSGSRILLVTRALPSGAELGAEPLSCEWRLIAPTGNADDVAYGALAVKWAGPWTDGPLFTAVDLEHGVYHMRGAPETETGDPSREHVAWGAGSGLVALRDGDTTHNSPVFGHGGVPADVAIASASVQTGYRECLDALVPARVAADAYHDSCPLLTQARNPYIARQLVAAGADVHAKCADGRTPLTRAALAWATGAVEYLLEAGAAVCTRPLDALTLIGRKGSEFMSPFSEFSAIAPDVCGQLADDASALVEMLRAAAPKTPCEPGWWLGSGEGCSGLAACPCGKYCPGYRGQTNVARPCPAGTYGPQAGAVAVAQCRPCPDERPFSAPGTADISECLALAPAGSARAPADRVVRAAS